MTRRKILFLFVGFLVMLLGTTYVVLQETGASKAFVEKILARFIKSDFDLKGAIVNLVAGTITLEDFALFRPGSGTQTPLVSVEHVEFAVTTNPLGNVLSVEEILLGSMWVCRRRGLRAFRFG